MPTRVIQSCFHPALGAAAFPHATCGCTYTHHADVCAPKILLVKNLRTRSHRSKDYRSFGSYSKASSAASQARAGSPRCIFRYCKLTGINLGRYIWELRELRLRLLPSNVNCGQRHRELSAIKNTLAWNRKTHKAYGINTTKEDLRTLLPLLCRAMRLENEFAENWAAFLPFGGTCEEVEDIISWPHFPKSDTGRKVPGSVFPYACHDSFFTWINRILIPSSKLTQAGFQLTLNNTGNGNVVQSAAKALQNFS